MDWQKHSDVKKYFQKFGGQLCFGRNWLKAEDYQGGL